VTRGTASASRPGLIASPEDLDEDDWRRHNPRFQGESFALNLRLVERIRELADGAGCTPSQPALAWVLLQGRHIVPISGTRRPERVDENAGAVDVELSAADLARIDEVIPRDLVVGLRYPEPAMALLNG
jgi:aryl-alcohol dehydrogenase-like predicted oxidoreductase